MGTYATETEVRKRHGFHTRETYSESGGEVSVGDTLIVLNHETTSIITIKKRNGTTVTTLVVTTDYTLIEPKFISLVAAVVADDEYYIDYGTELESDVIIGHVEDATAIVKSYTRDRYGDTLLTTWETTTPDLVRHYTVLIAGYNSERNMMRDAHKFSSDAIEFLNMEYKRVMSELKEIKLGKREIPGADPLSDFTGVARGLDEVSIYESLSNLQNVDINKVDEDQGLDGSVFD